jgi:hypothetical protein
MKNNKDIIYLIENGLHIKTLSKMNESQIKVLVEKFKNSKEETKEVETVTTTKVIATPEETKKGIPIQGKTMAKQLPDGRIEFSETEFTESVEVDSDPNKKTETQDPVQVGPGTNDGDNDDDDGMPTSEGVIKEKFVSHAQQNFFWAKCNTTKGVQRQKWCQLAKEFSDETTKKDYKKMPEKLHPEKTVKVKKEKTNEQLEKFLEKKISEMVEKEIQPKMSKKDLIDGIKKRKNKNSMILSKPKKMEMFSNEAPMELPISRMFSIGKTK